MDKVNLPSSNSLRIAFIHSSWHLDILDQGKKAFLEEFENLGYGPDQVDIYQLPGAFEIPLKCKSLASKGKYALIIASGFVVDGGIYRHEFVADAVINGLMNVQLETSIPILSMVLTPKKYDSSNKDNDFFLKHFKVKGQEIANATHALLSSISH